MPSRSKVWGAGTAVCVQGLLVSSGLYAQQEFREPSKDIAGRASTRADTDRDWYGWKILMADAAGLLTGAALALGIDADEENRPSDLGLIGSAWYGVGAVAAPAIHFAHDGFGRGISSLGMRTLLPPLAGVVGLVGGCIGHGEFDSDCRRSGMTSGTLVGLAGAAALDAAILAHPRATSPSGAAEPGEHWYGWELLLLDGGALLAGTYLSIRPPRNDDGEKLAPQVALWASDYLVGFFGGPIVHLVHGEWQHSLASFGVRGLIGPMGVLPGLMGHCAATAGETGCSKTGATLGLLGGLLLVDLFDAFVLGYEEVEAAEASALLPRVSAGPGFIAVSGRLP